MDYAQFMQTLVEECSPEVEGIRLVQDPLNTHTPGSFYEVLPAPQAFELAQRFEVHYTPIKGSWLNMAEIEFAALSKQCLGRRKLEDRTINWTFAQADAREKMVRHYNYYSHSAAP